MAATRVAAAARNTHRSDAMKFTTLIAITANTFATSGGSPHRPANNAINPAFPAIDAAPLES